MDNKNSNILEKLTNSFECKQGAVRAVRFSADGNYSLTCGSDKSLKLWNPHKGSILKVYCGHGYEVLDARGSFDNSQLCSCGMDKSVILWDVASGKILRKYRGHASVVNCVAFNDEATAILSASNDGTVKAWDTRSRGDKPVQTLDEARDSVVALEATDHELLTGAADCRVRRYDLRNGQLHTDFMGSAVTSVCFSRDRQCVLVSTLDNTLRLIDTTSGELLNEFKGHANSRYKIDSCVSCSDTHVITGSEDGAVYIYDLIEAKVCGKLTHAGCGTIHSLSHHPSQPCLLTASGTRCFVWKPGTEQEGV